MKPVNFIFSVISILVVGVFAQAADVADFKLPSELKIISYPITDSAAKTLGGLRKDQNEIAITIDDGPTPETTPKILEIFRQHGVKATFFLVGKNAKKYPELVKAILREGHSVGNHTWSHPQMPTLSLAAASQEIDQSADVLNAIVEDMQRHGETENAVVQPFFRFPFGSGATDEKLVQLLAKRGLANFFWRMTSHDSRTKDQAVALKTSIEMLDKYRGGIFLMHETHPAGLAMLPKFLEELHRRQYKTFYFQVQR